MASYLANASQLVFLILFSPYICVALVEHLNGKIFSSWAHKLFISFIDLKYFAIFLENVNRGLIEAYAIYSAFLQKISHRNSLSMKKSPMQQISFRSHSVEISSSFVPNKLLSCFKLKDAI